MKCGFLNLFFVCCLVPAAGFPLAAQDLRIRVLNGKNGKPVPGECINVAVGGWHGADLNVPTNSDGAIVLHLRHGEIGADPVAPRACNGMAYTSPKAIPKGKELLAFLPNWQVSCEVHSAHAPGEPIPLDKSVPSYSIQMILDSGMSASNTCGKVRVKANPGELVLFVRPPTFWEAMKR